MVEGGRGKYKPFLLYCACSCLCTSLKPVSERDRCPPNSCLCPFFLWLALSSFFFFLPSPLCISFIQLTTPPHCNFCVTHFTNTQKLKHTVGCKVGAWSVMFISLHFNWCESGWVCACLPSCMCVCLCAPLFSCTLDSCSLYCLTSFLPPLALPGALAAVISMFSFKSPWKRRGDGLEKGETGSMRIGNWFLRWRDTLSHLPRKPMV